MKTRWELAVERGILDLLIGLLYGIIIGMAIGLNLPRRPAAELDVCDAAKRGAK